MTHVLDYDPSPQVNVYVNEWPDRNAVDILVEQGDVMAEIRMPLTTWKKLVAKILDEAGMI